MRNLSHQYHVPYLATPGMGSRIKGLLFGIALGVCLHPTIMYANPEGGVVTGGDAQISTPSANVVQINQASDKAMINWQKFNVAPHETVNFQQPSRSSITLNRINPENGVSSIYGKINANGQVWLVNGAGIYFGPSASVNVAGLIATTASISDQNFLAGRFYFEQSLGWEGAVINEGYIKVHQAGLAALVGPGVINQGLIEAYLGTVVLAAGNAFTVNFSGNELIGFAIDQEVLAPARDQNGNQLKSAVENTGTISADGGRVLMSARTASDILDHTIRMKGIAQVKSVYTKNGELILDGGNGLVEVSGKIIASGKNSGETGGTVKITGKVVALTGDALIDASGDVGGGSVFIGGNAHGIGLLQNSQYAFFGSNANVNADALTRGNGGTVVLWADIGTKFYGSITARGGAVSGNGGWVETSGKEYLESWGSVIANATHGTAGSWLLDPANVTITTAADSNGSFDGGSPNEFTTTAGTANADVDTINASLTGGTSVTILTTPGGGQAGNITVTDAISKTGGGDATLTLTAVGNITVNANISSDTNKLHVTLAAGGDITIGGIANSTISTLGGDFTATAQNDFIMSNATGTVVGAIDVNGGKVTISANQNGAGGEDFNMRAGSSISSDSTASDAVSISVNTNLGGTGSAFIRGIETGDGGGITVQTNTGGNITGTDITMAAGVLDVGTGSITLTIPQIIGNNIGTAGTPIQVIAGSLSATAGATGLFVTNTGTGILDLGTISSTGAFTLNSTTSSGITDSGTISITGDTTLVAGASQNITLNTASNDFSTLAMTSVNDVTIIDTNGIDLGASTISGIFNLTSAGTVTQSGAVTVAGDATFTAGSGNDVTLQTATNNFSKVSVVSANNFSLRDTDALQLGNVTGTTSLSFTAGGALTQEALTAITTPTFTGLTRLTGGAPITLENTGNEVTTLDLRARNTGNTANAAGAISYVDATGFDVAAANTTSTVTLVGGDAMTQSGSMTGTTLSAKTLNNLGAAITLTNTSNAFTTINLQSRNAADSANAAGAIAYTDTNAVVVYGVDTTSTFALSANGTNTQSGVMTVDGVATFTATDANTDFLFSSAANNFGATPVFSISGLGTLRDISLRNINVGATAPTLPAALSDLTLEFDNAAVVLPAISLSSTLNVTAGGDITQSGALSVTGITTLNSGATNDITLNNSSNAFSTIVITNADNVAIVDTNGIIFGSTTVNGTLDVTAGGSVTDSGTLTITGVATFNVTLPNDVVLNSAGNDFSTIAVTADDVTIVDINGIILGTTTTTDDYTLTVAGTVTQSGVLSIGGDLTIAAGVTNNITLADASNNLGTVIITSGNDVLLVDAGALNIGASTVTGNMTITSGGALTDSGNIVISGANGLTATSIGGATLNNAGNQFGELNVTNSGGGAINIVNSASLTITGFSQSGGGTTTFSDTGTLTISDGVTIDSANATLAITATDLDLSTTGALNSGTAATTITQNTAAGSIGLGNTAGTMSISGAELQRMTSTGLTFTAPTDGQIIVDGITAANSANNAGTTTLTATAGTLGTISFQTGTSSFGTLTSTADAGITVSVDLSTTVGAMTFTVNTGTLTVSDGVTASTTNQNITMTATDLNLNTTGALNAGTGTISITQNTATGSIGLGNAVGTMSISGSELQRMTASNLTINAPTNGSIIIDGVTAANSANISGITTLAATAGTLGNITFQTAASIFNALTANADNGITVGVDLTTLVGAMTLDADANDAAGSNDALVLGANLDSAGAMTLSATTGGISINAAIDLTSGSTMAINNALNGTHNLTLDAVGNITASAGLGTTTSIQALTVTANRFVADIRVGSLTIDLNTGNMEGTINGKSSIPAILTIIVLNTLYPRTIYFDGLDIYYILNPSVLPETVLPPTYLGVSSQPQLYFSDDELFLQETGWPALAKKISEDCIGYGPLIEMCGEWN